MPKPIAITQLLRRKGIILLHLAFWVLHSLVIYLIIFHLSANVGFSLAFTAANVIINLGLAYTNLWWLMPGYLEKKEYAVYVAGIILLILLGSFIRTLVLEGVSHIFDPPNVPDLAFKGVMSFGMSFLILVLTAPFYLVEDWLKRGETTNAIVEEKSESGRDYCFVKTDYKLVKLFYRDILYIESLRDLVRIHTPNEKYLSQLSMKKMEQMLPPDQFVRVHRTYIIAMGKISSVFGNTVEIGDQKIPIGKTYRETFFKQLEIL